MQVLDRLRNRTALRVFSLLTCLVLCLSLVFSILGSLTGILIQTLASATITIGVLLELHQILTVVYLTDRANRVGWVLHRFSYAALLTIVLSFLLIAGGRFLSSFSISGGNLMIVAVIAYVVQASFGISLSVMSYHLLQEEAAWCVHVEPISENQQS